MKRSGSEKAKLKKSPSTKKLKDSSKREADSGMVFQQVHTKI